MKTWNPSLRPPPQGYALMLMLGFVCVSAVIVGSALSWASNNALMTQRNNQYFQTVAAAEAATEKVLARLEYDYQRYGEGRAPIPGQQRAASEDLPRGKAQI